MLAIENQATIYVYTASIDMRKAINGLVVLLAETFAQNPQTGDLFVFTNKQRNKIKILFWHKNGFVIYYKRLERGRFQYSPYLQDEKIIINTTQLSALLIGFDFYLLGENTIQHTTDFY